ncbi:MAG: hypothetical protein KAI24_04605 [Planctomycetes bacterium]|nr:hypothetical protein [Planctomycetota bacterium]
MPTRTKSVPVAHTGDTVQPRRRAAAVKNAIKSYTQEDTIAIDARWDDESKTWEITFEDE